MITFTDQYMHRFQNKGCMNSTQTPCIYFAQVKICIGLQSVAILFTVSVYILTLRLFVVLLNFEIQNLKYNIPGYLDKF